ncbi:MAG: M23 family metallopeptidase [Actinomycetota bacterium]
MRLRLRSFSLALLISILLTGLAGLPMALADPSDPSDPTPDPSPTSEPTPKPDPPPDPTPDPQPTNPPSPPPDDTGGTPSPKPPPDQDGKGDGKDGKTKDGKQDRKPKKDPFAMAGPQNTARLVSLLAPLTQRGMSLERAFLKVVGPFPVAGLSWWSDDWHAARCCPYPHLHQGLDMFAPVGTPLVAAADGYISQKVNSPSAAGLGLEVTDARGIQYFYAHLSAFEPGIEVGTPVEMGEVIGYVGDTGNARGTTPHVHFEYQPGGVPAPPKPWVDRWLKIAERKAIQLVHQVTGGTPKVERLSFRLTRLFDLVDAERTDIQEAVSGDGGELLALAGFHPAATYDMARDTAGTMAWEIDWGEEASDQIATGIEDYQREMTEQSLMGILQDPEAEHAEVPAAGMLPGSPGVAVAEGIGDPMAPVMTDDGVVAPAPPGAPGGVSGYDAIGTETGLPVGAPGALAPSSTQVTDTVTTASLPAIGESNPRTMSWRAGLGAGLVRVLSVYGALSTSLPSITETLWHEIIVAVRDEGARGLLRSDTEARFPAAAGTP